MPFKVQRALIALLILEPEQLPEVLDVLYPAFWVEKKALQNRDVFEPVFASVLGSRTAEDVVAQVILMTT